MFTLILLQAQQCTSMFLANNRSQNTRRENLVISHLLNVHSRKGCYYIFFYIQLHIKNIWVVFVCVCVCVRKRGGGVLEACRLSLGLGSSMIPALAVVITASAGGGDRTFEIFLGFSTAVHMGLVTHFFFFFNKKEKEIELCPVFAVNSQEVGKPQPGIPWGPRGG